MQFPIDWSDERSIAAAFRYAARTGIGRHMPMPIHWYQMHQVNALDVLEAHARRVFPDVARDIPLAIRLHRGVFQTRIVGYPPYGKWQTLTTPMDIFRKADSLTRGQ